MTDALETTERGEAKDPSVLRQVVETVITVAVAILLSQAVRAFLVEGYKTPTGSMIPTIQTQDFTLFSKISYRFQEPVRGDIVTLDDPQGVLPMIMKRVIAIEGQTVDVRDGQVWVDGKPLDEPYTHGKPTRPGTIPMPVRIPEGSAWVMGDNRTNSLDSRYFGPVPLSTIHAKAVLTYWPPARWGVPSDR